MEWGVALSYWFNDFFFGSGISHELETMSLISITRIYSPPIQYDKLIIFLSKWWQREETILRKKSYLTFIKFANFAFIYYTGGLSGSIQTKKCVCFFQQFLICDDIKMRNAKTIQAKWKCIPIELGWKIFDVEKKKFEWNLCEYVNSFSFQYFVIWGWSSGALYSWACRSSTSFEIF